MTTELALSALAHTWLIDLDGSIMKHNGYKLDGADSLLPGAADFFAGLPPEDTVIFLTSRPQSLAAETEKFLKASKIRFDRIIYGLPYGERIVVNDAKPSGLVTCHAVCLPRDQGMSIVYQIDENL